MHLLFQTMHSHQAISAFDFHQVQSEIVDSWDFICKKQNELKSMKRKKKNREEDKILQWELIIEKHTRFMEELEEKLDKMESGNMTLLEYLTSGPYF